MAGPDLELIREVRAGFGGAVLAAGGIRDAADVDAVRRAGADGAVVGRALLEGSFGLTVAPGSARTLSGVRHSNRTVSR